MPPEDIESSVPPSGFGDELRLQREMRGITVREISEVTKISVRFLEAIEAEDFAILPAPVFTRGFIREYAKQLGVEADDLVDRYMQIVRRERRIEEAERAEMADRISGKHHFGSRWPMVFLLVVGLVSIGVAIGLYSHLGVPWESSATVPVATSPAPASVTDVVAPARAEPPAVSTTAAEAAPLRLEIMANEDCYLTMSIDGKRVINGEVLHAGDRRTYEAENEIRFETIGNAGGIRVFLDGRQLAPFGERGEVVKNRVLDRSSIAH